MAILAEDFFKERKYPFIVTLLVLLICVTLFLFGFNSSTSNLVAFYSVIEKQPPLNPSQAPAEYNTANQKEHKLPPNVTNVSTKKKKDLPQQEENIDWKLCKDLVNVDLIPCLDNLKAIKALKSRKHMEHRERHCPETSLHCLLPLPKGYKVSVPWPESRDKVRLIKI